MKYAILAFGLLLCGPAFAATCHISEYANMVTDLNSAEVPVAREPAVATQVVTYTTSTQSAALNAVTRFVRVVCSAKAHFVFGTSPTATASSPYVASDTTEYFGVVEGQSYKIAFYDGSS